MRSVVVLVASLCLVASAGPVHATEPQLCWQETDADGPPTGRVAVTIESIRLNTDMEGGDDWIPGYDNRADVFGIVTIDGVGFELPKINESDHPHWHPPSGTFVVDASSQVVPITIEIYESDEFVDDVVDINADGAKKKLDLLFDTCSLTLTGDLGNVSAASFLTSSGSGDAGGEIKFTVSMEDGRPVSENDLALVELDVVQVVPHSERLVAEKPSVVIARVANNHPYTVSTEVRVRINSVGGPSFSRDDSFPITVPGQAVKLFVFYQADPLRFPIDGDYHVTVSAEVDPDGTTPDGSSPGECARLNNGENRAFYWRVIPVQTPPILWTKTGRPTDTMDPDAVFDEYVELGSAYVNATYPVASLGADKSPLPLFPPTTAALDWLTTILNAFKVPWVDCPLPYALVFELDRLAILLGYDRMIGVVPRDWFGRFTCDGINDMLGMSLMEWMPHAVIVQARDVDGGYFITSPAHELGHTYSISADADLKGWWCSIDASVLPAELGDVKNLPCALSGGYDEYLNPNRPGGNPSMGYWVERGDEPAAYDHMVNRDVCGSECFMQGGVPDRHLIWDSWSAWIDAEDYDKLLDEIEEGSGILYGPPLPPDDELIYVSGLIAVDDSVYLGDFYRGIQGSPDAADFGDDAMYGIAFVGGKSDVLAEVGVPLSVGPTDVATPAPVTAFGLRLRFPEGTQSIEIWNRVTGKKLASRAVSPTPPKVTIRQWRTPQLRRGDKLTVRWAAWDDDGDSLEFSVLVKRSDSGWGVAADRVTGSRAALDTAELAPGSYLLKVLAADGVNLTETKSVAFTVQ